MSQLTTYLHLNGTCREAMEFYHSQLGGDLMINPYSGMPGPPMPGTENLIMHARITTDSVILMASDCPPGRASTAGNNFSISIECTSREETARLYHAFAEGGKVKRELGDMFWGAYWGMVEDKFGIAWMFNYQVTPL